MALLGLVGLRALGGLVCGPLSAYVVHLRVSSWHHAIGRKWGPPEVLTQLEFIGVCQIRRTWACFDHISLIRTQNHVSFLLLDSLLIEEFFDKI